MDAATLAAARAASAPKAAFLRLARMAGSARRADVVAGRSAWPGLNGASNGTATYGNYRSVHAMQLTASDLRLVYASAWAHESVALGNSLVVTAAIEYPTGTTSIYPVTFSGRNSVTIDQASYVISDPLGIQVPSGAVLAVRTYVTPATNVGTGGKWPVGDSPTYGILGGTTYSEAGLASTGTVTDQTLSQPYFTTNATTSTGMYKPVAVLGTPATVPTVALGGWGDSIMAGIGENVATTATPYPIAGRGAWRRAVNDQYSFLNLAMPGETAKQASTDANRLVRGPLLTGCSHVFCNLGVNDLKTDGATLAQLQSYVLNAWTYAVNRGITGRNGRSGVIHSTLIPNTTSSDGFASSANQTVTAWESTRVGFNTWLRAGAPIDPASKAAVAVGTVGALVAGNAGHPLLTYLDLAATVETGLNSGKWLPATRGISDAAITTATAVLTSATANFTSADVGKYVVIQGAGTSGAQFSAVIATFTNTTTVSLNASAGTTVSGAAAGIGTYTFDGTHPTSDGHALMASASAWATPTALATLLA